MTRAPEVPPSGGPFGEFPDHDSPRDDAAAHEWLFKENDTVLGPVAASVLVDRIRSGALPKETPVARDGQAFRPMQMVPLFREAYEHMLEKKRRVREAQEYRARVGRARTLRVATMLVLVLVPASLAAAAGHQLKRAAPWDTTPTWIKKVPPLVDLPPRPVEVQRPAAVAVAATAPVEAASNPAEAETEKPEAPEPKNGRAAKTPRNKGREDKPEKKIAAATATESPKDDKPAGPVPETLTNEQAIAPLKNAKDALKGCFKAEMEANPDVPSPVVLSYTVTEDGKAANVNLDNRELRGRPVVECVRRALSTLRWPRFSGERKNVSVPFKLSKPTKPGDPK